MRRKGESCDPFVDIQVTPTYKRRMHSEVHQKTQNPVFNQQFEFEVPPYEIREQTVTFTVLDFNQQLSHESIGNVCYKLDSLDHDAFFAGKEFTLWNKLEKVSICVFKLTLPVLFLMYPLCAHFITQSEFANTHSFVTIRICNTIGGMRSRDILK